MTNDYASRFYIDETNEQFGPVARWNTNDRIPFNDTLQEFLAAGLIDTVVLKNSNHARSVETAEFLNNYRANYRGPSAEELLEARAAFGAGSRIVNIITGTEYTV